MAAPWWFFCLFLLIIFFNFSGDRANCDTCNTNFNNQDEKLIHDCNDYSTTDELDLKFQTLVDVSPIDEEIKSHSCNECNKIFVTFRALDKHIKLIHNNSCWKEYEKWRLKNMKKNNYWFSKQFIFRLNKLPIKNRNKEKIMEYL